MTSTSTTAAAIVLAKAPKAMPRPVTTLAEDSFDAATFACQFEALATPSSTLRHRSGASVAVVAMFCSRNATGSILAANASSSIACSAANADCGASGARRNVTLK